MPSCPICKRAVAPRSENKAFPFCSARCKQVDLGNWLNETYRVPTDETPDEEGSSAVAGGGRETKES